MNNQTKEVVGAGSWGKSFSPPGIHWLFPRLLGVQKPISALPFLQNHLQFHVLSSSQDGVELSISDYKICLHLSGDQPTSRWHQESPYANRSLSLWPGSMRYSAALSWIQVYHQILGQRMLLDPDSSRFYCQAFRSSEQGSDQSPVLLNHHIPGAEATVQR